MLQLQHVLIFNGCILYVHSLSIQQFYCTYNISIYFIVAIFNVVSKEDTYIIMGIWCFLVLSSPLKKIMSKQFRLNFSQHSGYIQTFFCTKIQLRFIFRGRKKGMTHSIKCILFRWCVTAISYVYVICVGTRYYSPVSILNRLIF
jgi:hypothetical protein